MQIVKFNLLFYCVKGMLSLKIFQVFISGVVG